MFEKTDRSRVDGFLRAEGTSVVNGKGEEILLTGWGLGNWLLPEGYMWLAGEGTRFDRPRRIEQVVRELTDDAYAASFWHTFRDTYITEADIAAMAGQGYNSVRIPINWRILLEDAPGITWIEEGFALLDRCIDWCEKHRLYVFLDLHGAPGGQTGANIDDSVDDLPRLFMDRDSWDKAIAIWEKLAARYRDRWIVGGYDLLNEPLKPGLSDAHVLDIYLPKLVAFYDACIKAIRAIDPVHMLSIEGSHWSTDLRIFYKRYDDNMVLHFHRYACMPGREVYAPYLAAAQQLNQPLWLGETGENTAEWFAAMYPLSLALNIGYNLWPWKKMDCENSPLSILPPEGWAEIIGYTHGGPKPTAARAKAILDAYLENIQCARCTQVPKITQSVFRRPGFSVRGTDFDELPGKGLSFSGTRGQGNLYYRANTQMDIIPAENPDLTRRFTFDSGWDRLELRMEAGEFAQYFVNAPQEAFTASVFLQGERASQIRLSWDTQAQSIPCEAGLQAVEMRCQPHAGPLRITVESGCVRVVRIETSSATGQ